VFTRTANGPYYQIKESSPNFHISSSVRYTWRVSSHLQIRLPSGLCFPTKPSQAHGNLFPVGVFKKIQNLSTSMYKRPNIHTFNYVVRCVKYLRHNNILNTSNIQGVSGGTVNILGGGSMNYSE
jgi:hypothetical protein